MKRFLSFLPLLLAFVALPAWAQMQIRSSYGELQARVGHGGRHCILGLPSRLAGTFIQPALATVAPRRPRSASTRLRVPNSSAASKRVLVSATSTTPYSDMPVRYFEGSCTFTQRVRLTASDYVVKGYLTYGACNDQNCLPPTNDDASLIGTDGPKAASSEAKASATPAEGLVETAKTSGSAILNGPAAMADTAAAADTVNAAMKAIAVAPADSVATAVLWAACCRRVARLWRRYVCFRPRAVDGVPPWFLSEGSWRSLLPVCGPLSQ